MDKLLVPSEEACSPITFDWSFFTEKDLDKLNEDIAEWESDTSDIFGTLYVKVDRVEYMVDIGYDYWSWDDKHLQLDIYFENDGHHGRWIDSIRTIKSAKDYKRFQKRAETLVKKFLVNVAA